jgi:hypothetical protein
VLQQLRQTIHDLEQAREQIQHAIQLVERFPR